MHWSRRFHSAACCRKCPFNPEAGAAGRLCFRKSDTRRQTTAAVEPKVDRSREDQDLAASSFSWAGGHHVKCRGLVGLYPAL